MTTVNLMLEGVSAQPLLKDALGFEWLEGRSTIAVALAGQGVSERQIVEHLERQGRPGDDATAPSTASTSASSCASIEQGRFGGLRIAPGEKTPFSEFAGTFTIANGVAAQPGPAAGEPARARHRRRAPSICPARRLDYTVRPKIAGAQCHAPTAP